MIRRLFGLLMLLGAILGIAIAVGGVYAGANFTDDIATALESNLEMVSRSLDAVEDSLELGIVTIADVNVAVATVEITAENLSTTVADTSPLITEVTTIATEEIPDSVEAVTLTIPNIAEIAGAVEGALLALNQFAIDENFAVPNPFNPDTPLYEFGLNFDLGIDYDPAEPFDVTIIEVGSSLDEIPDQLRSLEEELTTVNEDLVVISENLATISGDISIINARIAEVEPLLEQYLGIVVDVHDQIRVLQSSIRPQLEPAKMGINIAMLWLGLTQLAPLYLGFALLWGQRLVSDNAMRKMVEEMAEEEASAPALDETETADKDE